MSDTKFTDEELREMAKTSRPGSPLIQHLSVKDTATYLGYRQQYGWPLSRSITCRLVKSGRTLA